LVPLNISIEESIMLNRKMKPLAVAIGTAFALSAATGLAVADEEELFEVQVLDGILLADAHEGEGEGEGKCGEGKCGEDKDGGEGEGDDAPEDSDEAPEE
jgi:uncharacterized low-complexity protein